MELRWNGSNLDGTGYQTLWYRYQKPPFHPLSLCESQANPCFVSYITCYLENTKFLYVSADIDECSTGAYRCLKGFECKNLVGTYRCNRIILTKRCRKGYKFERGICRGEFFMLRFYEVD